MNFSGPAPDPEPAAGALFVGSDVYRRPAFGKHHPLSIIRVAGVVEDVLADLARGKLEPQAVTEAGGPRGCRQLANAADTSAESSGGRRGMGRRARRKSDGASK